MPPSHLDDRPSRAASSLPPASGPAISPIGDDGIAAPGDVLFGDGPGANPGFMAAVAPSGRSVVLTCQDPSGRPSAITAIRSSNEVQSVSLVGLTAGGTFALTFGGRATAPIATQALPPADTCYFTLTGLTPGAAHALSANYAPHPYSSEALLFRVFDGATQDLAHLLGTPQAVNEQAGPSDLGDAGYNWANVGTYTPTGTTLTVQLSSGSSRDYTLAAIRVAGPGPVAYVSVADATKFAATNPGSSYTAGGQGGVYGGSVFNSSSGGTAYQYSVTGGAQAIQSALQSLPNIRGGGVAVAGSGGGYQLTFVGPLAGAPQALITCPDPAVAIARVAGGGVGSPTLSINGGAPVVLGDWLWSETNKDSPVATCILPQAAPALRLVTLFSDVFSMVGYWNEIYDSSCLSGSRLVSADPTLAVNYPFLALPPGTYRFAATWPASPTLSVDTRFLIKDASGAVIDTVVVDQTKAPADYTAQGRGWKYIGGTYATDKFNGGLTLHVAPSGTGGLNACLDAIEFTRTSPDDSIVIGPNDSASITVPSGWLTTKAGPVAAASGRAILPPSATSIMPAFSASPKAMRVGYNVNSEVYYSLFPTLSNFVNRLDGCLGLARDPNGFPTRIAGPVFSYPVVTSTGTPGGKRLQNCNIPSGRYTLTWAGASNCELSAFGGTVTQVASSANKRVYDVRPIPGITYCAGFNIVIHGTALDPADQAGSTYVADATNIKLYPPDPADPTGLTDWANPTKFHPTALYKMQGAKCLRFLDPSSVNINPYSDFSQIKPAGHISRGTAQSTVTIPIASIKEPAVPRFFNVGGGPFHPVEVQITTAVPHGLFDGANVQLNGTGVATFSGAGQPPTSLDGLACYRLVKVVDATNLLLQVNPFPQSPTTMTNTLTGGTLQTVIGTCYPLQDMVDLVAATKAEELWFNVAVTATRAVGGCVDQIASFFAANLPPGVKVHVEFGNECWNTFFPTSFWAQSLTNQAKGTTDQDYVPGYVRATKDVHDRFQAIFSAAGRPNDVIHTFASEGNNPALTARVAAEAARIGARLDEMAVAGYFGNYPISLVAEPNQLAIYPKMTPDQCLDYQEVNVEYGGYDQAVASQAAVLAPYYPSAKVVFYEASLGAPVPASDPDNPPSTPNYFQRSNSIKRHPRMFGIMLRMFQKCQDAGLSLWNQYILGLDYRGWAWGTYEGCGQLRGTGDATLDAINVTDPFALDQVKCETGGAIYSWSTLVKSTRKASQGRNGKLRAIGLPKGVSRTVR